ncbi:MAG: TonB-dependent receptor [Verrucomicrobiota bacterium]
MTYNLAKPGFLRANHHSIALTTRALPWIAMAVCAASPARAQESTASPTLLQEVVVTATRTDESAAQVTSAYTKINADEMERDQFQNVKQAVNLAPGVFLRDTGTLGASTGIAIRGNRPVDTLLLVDGVKSSSSLVAGGAPLLSFASHLNLEEVTTVRGAHSSLFGSDAIGGVVSMQTKRGSGDPKAMLFFEGGSFNTFREGITSDGSLGALDYSMHYAHENTSNQRPNNDMGVDSGSLRLDWTVSDKLTLGVAVRSQVGKYQEPSSIRLVDIGNNDPNAHMEAEATTVSTYAELKATDCWTTKLTLGCYKERYDFQNPFDPASAHSLIATPYWDGQQFVYPAPSPATPGSSWDVAESANWTADWQNTFQLSEKNRFVAGMSLLYETGHDATDYITPYSPSAPQTSSLYALNEGVYAQDQWEVLENLVLTGGARFDHYQLAGNAFTYRGGAAYLVEATRTKLRASYGTAFKEPTFYQSYNTERYTGQKLDPERSHSWDAGLDQYFLGDKLSLGCTYFHCNTNDLIEYVSPNYNTPYFANLNASNSHGIEASAVAKLNDHWQARLAYTWTESEVEANYWTSLSQTVISGMQRAPRVPRNTVSAETNYTFDLPVGKLTLGTGVAFVGQQEDVDFSLFRPVQIGNKPPGAVKQVDMADYTLVRVYGRYEMNPRVAVTARVENVGNVHYQTTLGYPGLGLGAYGGVEIRF